MLPSSVEHLVHGTSLGRWRTNCYLVGDRTAGRAVVVDPGEGAEVAVPALLERLGLTLEAVLLTHGHIDHLWAAPVLAEAHDVAVHLHPDDLWLYEDPGAAFGGTAADVAESLGLAPWLPDTGRLVPLADRQRLHLAGVDIEVRHDPGHTPGHCTFLVPALHAATVELDSRSVDVEGATLFSGDLVFAGSIGRSDLAGGDHERLLASLRSTLGPLDPSTVILPGHGPATTVGIERATNPFRSAFATDDGADTPW
jgi:glyoxylase-like metal-dependent hydrolase (beta-lactamase superfamily II)